MGIKFRCPIFCVEKILDEASYNDERSDEFDDEEDYYEDPKIELDEEVLISFLNEYYEVNPKSLPKPEYY